MRASQLEHSISQQARNHVANETGRWGHPPSAKQHADGIPEARLLASSRPKKLATMKTVDISVKNVMIYNHLV